MSSSVKLYHPDVYTSPTTHAQSTFQQVTTTPTQSVYAMAYSSPWIDTGSPDTSNARPTLTFSRNYAGALHDAKPSHIHNHKVVISVPDDKTLGLEARGTITLQCPTGVTPETKMVLLDMLSHAIVNTEGANTEADGLGLKSKALFFDNLL